MSLGQSIRQNTAWLLSGNMVRRGLKFAYGIALARILVPADFGLFVTIQIFTGAAGLIATGGMSQSLVQARELGPHDYRAVFTVQLLIGVAIYTFFFTIAPWFALWFGDPRYEALLRISTVSFLLRPFRNVPAARLKREMRFKWIAITQVVSMIVGSSVSVTLALEGFGVWSLVYGGIIGTLVNIVLVSLAARWVPTPVWSAETIQRLGGFGLRFSANSILRYVKTQTGNLVLAQFAGPAAVGLYNKADSLSAMPRELILGSSYQTLFRGLSQEQDNLDKSRYLYLRALTLGTVYILPVYVCVWWLAEPFIVFVYGGNWLPAAHLLEILAISGLLLVGSPSGAVLAAQDRIGKEIRLNIETGVLMVAVTILGYQLAGMVGVAWAVAALRLYTNARLYALVGGVIGVRLPQLLDALMPAYVLNGILLAGLYAGHTLGLHGLRHEAPGLYVTAMGSLAVSCYGLALLYLPLQDLETEARRWKRTLRLAA